MADRKHVSRDEDYGDYAARDTRDGWPYPDGDDAHPAKQNAAYGTRGAHKDQLDSEGIAVTLDPVARHVDGAPLPFDDETNDSISDDDLEARVMEALEGDDKIDVEMLDLTIRGGVAVLDGAVDSEEDRHRLIGFLRGVKGVRDVQSDGLIARGVDSDLPRDTTY